MAGEPRRVRVEQAVVDAGGDELGAAAGVGGADQPAAVSDDASHRAAGVGEPLAERGGGGVTDGGAVDIGHAQQVAEQVGQAQ